MCTHESKACPRCGKQFECKPGTITECQCYGFKMTAEVNQFLEQRYTDCLCRSCLDYLQQDVHRFKEQYFSRNS